VYNVLLNTAIISARVTKSELYQNGDKYILKQHLLCHLDIPDTSKIKTMLQPRACADIHTF